MVNIPVMSQDELVERVKNTLREKPSTPSYNHYDIAPEPTDPAAFTMILGAGFSYGVVPLVNELMEQSIGDYYFPDQDQSSLKRPESVLRKDSAGFWAEYNKSAREDDLPIVELDRNGLPTIPGAAYQSLFMYKIANKMLEEQDSDVRNPPGNFLASLKAQREPKEFQEKNIQSGEIFVKGFLRYLLDPGAEHGFGSTGRNKLNLAHKCLALLLEAQQLGRGWSTCAFCRTILTTNFDTLLQNALQMVNLLYRLTDRPKKGFDHSELLGEEGPIHLVYVHGSILRHNPASTIYELSELAQKNVDILKSFLETKDIIVIGYSGWNDGLMTALRRCDAGKHSVYWCDTKDEPASHIEKFFHERAGGITYVQIDGADELMYALYEELIPTKYRQDPQQRYDDWYDLIWRHENLV